MKQFCRILKLLVVIDVLLIAGFLSITARAQVGNPSNVCSPQNLNCYYELFERHSKPQMDSVKVSMYSTLYVYKHALS